MCLYKALMKVPQNVKWSALVDEAVASGDQFNIAQNKCFVIILQSQE